MPHDVERLDFAPDTIEEERVVAVALHQHRDVLGRHARAQLVREGRVSRKGRLRNTLRRRVWKNTTRKLKRTLVYITLFGLELE